MADWPSDPLVEARLRDYFASELRQAELDFPQLPARRRPSTHSGPRIALLSALAAVAVGLLVLRPPLILPGMPGSSSATAGMSPRPTVSPSPSEPALWSDGIPLIVAGEPVLRGQAIATHIAATTGDTAFLIGGYVAFVQADCYVPPNLPSSPLTAPCDDGWTLRDMHGFLEGSPLTASGPPGPPLMSHRLVLGASVPGWTAAVMGSPIVLRVHVHDERAAACAASIRDKCEGAIVVESVVWRGP